MQNSKLIAALKTLSKKEFRKFSEFVCSPFFNKNKNIISLLNFISDDYPEFSSEETTEEELFKKVFPNTQFDYFKLRNILSELFQLYISFLKITANEKREIEADINLLTELHERRQNVSYSQTEKKISKYLNGSKIKDENYYFLKHKLDRINTAHFKFEKSKYSFNSIQIEFDSFFQYAIVGLLQHYSKMLHNKNHGNINFDMKMLDQVLEYTKDKEFEESPSCQMYKQIILVELHKDEQDYKKLLDLKNKFENNISNEDLYSVLLVINSFAVYRLKLGDESYYKDRFQSLKEVIERKFFPDEVLFPNFITTFTAACMAGDYVWAENFKESFSKGIIPTEEQSNTILYCDAFLSYKKGDYDNALELFAKINFKLFLFKVMVKSYVIRIYYEIDLHEQTLNAIDAFRHYLKNEDMIAEEQKSFYYEFLKYITALSNLKLLSNRKDQSVDASLLKKNIDKMTNNSQGIKNWLLSKTELLL